MRIVIAGSGQAVSHWTPEEGESAPSPSSLRLEAARRALPEGVGRLGAVAVVRTTEDSLPTSTYPFGRDGNPPGTLARELGVEAEELILSGVGGQTPGSLLLEMANRIARGEIESALVVGAEAVGAAKLARRAGLDLDWSDGDPAPFTDRGAALDWLDPHELRHGLLTPAQCYGLMESGLAHLHADTLADHRAAMGRLLAPFSEVAAGNPYSMFPQARPAGWLAAPSPANYPVAYPYLRWHVAQDAVNQGAAVYLTTEAAAGAAGLLRLTYLRGGAEAVDAPVSRRGDISSNGIAGSVFSTLSGHPGFAAEAVDLWDIYSCFPVAVWTALAAFGMETPGLPAIGVESAEIGGYTPLPAPERLTVTGGLPFFGGPGNTYSLHALAEMHGRLAGTLRSGLVFANGGWMSKGAGAWLSGAPADYSPALPADRIAPERETVTESCTGQLEAFTYAHGRDGSPERGTALVRVRHTDRALAVAEGEALARLARDPSPIGAEVRVEVESGIGRLHFAEGLR